MCRHTRGRLAIALGLAIAVTRPLPARADSADPFEAVNRRIHTFNRSVQARVLGPVAELYLSAVPAGVRNSVRNALANLTEPMAALSGMAVGDFDLAANAAARFGINSTLGLAGVADRATAMGYPRRTFGAADVLCSWGVPRGPFLVLPVLGPSTLRDAGALVATSAAISQALGTDVYAAWSGTELFVGYAQIHHELERVDAGSLDPYAVYRSAYLQRRAAVCAIDRVEDLAAETDVTSQSP